VKERKREREREIERERERERVCACACARVRVCERVEELDARGHRAGGGVVPERGVRGYKSASRIPEVARGSTLTPNRS